MTQNKCRRSRTLNSHLLELYTAIASEIKMFDREKVSCLGYFSYPVVTEWMRVEFDQETLETLVIFLFNTGC